MPHDNYLVNICNPTNIFVLTFENFNCLTLIFRIEFELVLKQSEISNNNSDDLASLVGDYYSLIIRALQISSTTRNLVPRFKRWSKERRVGYEILTNLPFRVALIEAVNP